MDLEKLNLVELNAQEVQETEGGNLWQSSLEIGIKIVTCGTASAYSAVTFGLGIASGLRDGIINGATEARN